MQVDVDYGTSLLAVDVHNEGSLQRPSHPEHGGGNGIHGMQDRALSVGGLLTAAPDGVGGFVVKAQLPVSRTGLPVAVERPQ